MSPVFVEDIPIAVYDMDHSTASKTIVDQFYDCDTFEVHNDYDSVAKIEEGIMLNKIQGAVILPQGFGEQLAGKKGTEALAFVNATNFVIGNNVELFINTIFTTANAGIQIKLLEAGDMVPYQAQQSVLTMNVADRTLYNPQSGYLYYLYPGLLALLIQQAFLSVTPSILLKEKARLKNLPEDARVRTVQRIKMAKIIGRYTLLSLISLLICLLIAGIFFAYPLRGSLVLLLIFHAIFIAGLIGVSLVIASIFDDVTHCTQFTMFLTIPTLLSSGYSWPEYMMASGFAPVMKALWPLYYFINPFKDMMLKGAGLDIVDKYMIGGILFAVFWIPTGYFMYRRKLKIIRKVESI